MLWALLWAFIAGGIDQQTGGDGLVGAILGFACSLLIQENARLQVLGLKIVNEREALRNELIDTQLKKVNKPSSEW